MKWPAYQLQSWRHTHHQRTTSVSRGNNGPAASTHVLISGPIVEEAAAPSAISLREEAQLKVVIDEQFKLAVSGQEAAALRNSISDPLAATFSHTETTAAAAEEEPCPLVPPKPTAFQLGQLERLVSSRLNPGVATMRLSRADLLLRIESLRIVLALEEAAQPSGLKMADEPLYDVPRNLMMTSQGANRRTGSSRPPSGQQHPDRISYR